MANLFHSPTFALPDSNGDPISGQKLNFYETGTTNRADTFTDNALSVAHANPVVADGAGRFAAIYLQSISYKVVWTDADDVVLKTWDPVNGTFDVSGDDYTPSQQSPADMTVKVSAGRFFDLVSRTFVTNAVQTSSLIVAPVTNPRIDLVHIDRRTGVIGVVTGTEAASPVVPAVPAGGLPVAEVALAVGVTEIIDSLITDIRELAVLGTGNVIQVNTGADAGAVPLNAQAFVDVASATTTDIGAATSHNVRITGTTTITGLGTVASGLRRKVRFAAALTLTHNGTSLILPGTANITTAANDSGEFISLGSGNWLCLNYKKADGTAVVSITLETEQATTSGETVDFTGIASGVTRITVQLAGVSTSGTSGIQVVLGDSSGFETSGYSGVVARLAAAGAGVVVLSTGFDISDPSAWAAGDAVYGTVTLTLEDSANFSWVASVNIGGVTVNDFVASGGGIKSLSGVLTQVRLKTTNGSDVFDAGAVNILVE